MFNKDKIKGFICGVCVALVLTSGAVFADSISKTVNAVYNNIKIVIDGKEIVPKDANGTVVEPFIIDGTTYLPVRAVSEALGKEVSWDGETNTVYIGEMPKREFYALDASTLEPYEGKELLSVNDQSVKGGILNFYVCQDANDNVMRSYAENYSPELTLQTLTFNGTSMARFLVENAVGDIKLIYAACAAAEESGFAKKEETQKAIDEMMEVFMADFADENEFLACCDDFNIAPEDLKAFAKKAFLFENYINSIFQENLNKDINAKELEEEIRSSYITAKHILVSDEALAKDIIKKIEKGQNFDTLMEEYNEDPGATSEGYTFTKGEMVEVFETAALALKENTYTKTPVKSDYGYHIIYRLPFNEAYLSDIISEYKNNIAQMATDEYVAKLKDSAAVKYFADYETYITTIK